jgi:hypothetical protein
MFPGSLGGTEVRRIRARRQRHKEDADRVSRGRPTSGSVSAALSIHPPGAEACISEPLAAPAAGVACLALACARDAADPASAGLDAPSSEWFTGQAVC